MKADGLAEATISKRVKLARQIFKQAVRWKMLSDNPFADVRAGSQQNKDRMYFVTREEAEKVLDTCPDTQWKLLFALSRFGGLRCPSEHLALKWADVDWEHEPHPRDVQQDRATRRPGRTVLPIFPSFVPTCWTAFEEAEEGTEYVITRYRRRQLRTCGPNFSGSSARPG